MSIDRLSGKNPKQTDALASPSNGRSEKKSASVPARSAGGTPPADQVRISAEAQAAAGSQDVPRGELPAERVQQLGERIAGGFYDTPEVVELVARSILSELTDGVTS
jgi:hypothetical protein